LFELVITIRRAPHKYGAGSGSDRVQLALDSTNRGGRLRPHSQKQTGGRFCINPNIQDIPQHQSRRPQSISKLEPGR